MNTEVLDERAFFRQLQEANQKIFLKMIADYEAYISPILRSQGYKRINKKERTVIFSFGEMTFSRSRWQKGNEIRFPVDEKLGLVPRTRFSTEFLYQMTSLSNVMPYRKVVSVMELLKGIYITKNSVQRAIELSGKLLEEKEEYRILSLPEKEKKIKPEILYIEGDGVWIKEANADSKRKSIELSHYVVHTGSQKGARNQLKNKREIISSYHEKAKQQLIDLIHNDFEIDSNTVIVTNSDGGNGYSPRVFNEIAKTFQPKVHYHFWDAFHVHQSLKMNLRAYPSEILSKAFLAIKNRDKKGLEVVLDTAESLIESQEKQEQFLSFKRRILEQFRYTARPEKKGLGSSGIGIVESQHRKITYRMKNRGMYWSRKGADTMSQTILLSDRGILRNLFFGDWRRDYKKIMSYESNVGLLFAAPKSSYQLPFLKRRSRKQYKQVIIRGIND